MHIEKDGSDMKVLIEKDAFSEAEELLVCVGVVVRVLIYTGRNSDGRLSCRILNYDTVAGRINEQ